MEAPVAPTHGASYAPKRVSKFFAKIKVPLCPDAAKFRTTLLDRFAKAVFPWDHDRYPGLHRSLVHLFGGRVAYGSIKHWRVGRRAMPTWALERLHSQLEARVAVLATLEQECRAELTRRATELKRRGAMFTIDPATGQSRRGSVTRRRPKEMGPDDAGP